MTLDLSDESNERLCEAAVENGSMVQSGRASKVKSDKCQEHKSEDVGWKRQRIGRD